MVAERSFLPPDQTMSYHHHSNNTHQWNQRQQQIEQPWQQPPFNISPQPWKQPRFNSKPHYPCPIYNRPNSMETRRASSGQQTLRSSLEQSFKEVQQSLDKVKQLLDKLPPRHQQAEIQPMKSSFSTPTEPSYTTLELKTIKERKAAGLCEYCELKFFNGHKCKSSQLFLIMLGDEEQDPSEYGIFDEIEVEQKEKVNVDFAAKKVEEAPELGLLDEDESGQNDAVKNIEQVLDPALHLMEASPILHQESQSGINLLEVYSLVLKSQRTNFQEPARFKEPHVDSAKIIEEFPVQNTQPTQYVTAKFQQESALQIEEVYILEFEDVQRSLSNHTALVQIESKMMLINEEPTTSLLYAIKKVRLGIG